jgi:hypothetical protein
MIALIRIAIQLLSDVCRFAMLLCRQRGTLIAENLFLRRHLALYRERGVTAHRIDAATRISLTLLSRLFDWRSALVAVRPETTTADVLICLWDRVSLIHRPILHCLPMRIPVTMSTGALLCARNRFSAGCTTSIHW